MEDWSPSPRNHSPAVSCRSARRAAEQTRARLLLRDFPRVHPRAGRWPPPRLCGEQLRAPPGPARALEMQREERRGEASSLRTRLAPPCAAHVGRRASTHPRRGKLSPAQVSRREEPSPQLAPLHCLHGSQSASTWTAEHRPVIFLPVT